MFGKKSLTSSVALRIFVIIRAAGYLIGRAIETFARFHYGIRGRSGRDTLRKVHFVVSLVSTSRVEKFSSKNIRPFIDEATEAHLQRIYRCYYP